MLNHADECRQRADECRRNASQLDDDVLRGAYLDLARRWRKMAHQAQQKELGSNKRGLAHQFSRQLRCLLRTYYAEITAMRLRRIGL